MNIYSSLSDTILDTLRQQAIERRPDSRAIGAEIESAIKGRWEEIVRRVGGQNPVCYLERVRTIYDAGFDWMGEFYGLDVKSIDVSRGFTSGGVCAVKNLLDFMVNKNSTFLVCEVGYNTAERRVEISYVMVVPFHWIPVTNMHIENLGTGQIQFTGSLKGVQMEDMTKKEFYRRFSALALEHYAKVRHVANRRVAAIEAFIQSGFTQFTMK